MLLALSGVVGQGQTTVKGHVVNERGERVEYVTIGFEDDTAEEPSSAVGTISDAQGGFLLTIPKGQRKELVFTHVSYLPTVLPYKDYANGQELTIVLKDKVVELAEVVVGKKNKPKTIVGKGVPAPGVVGYGGPKEKQSADSPEGGVLFSPNKDYVISDILLTVSGCQFNQCTVSFNLYEKQGKRYVNILQKPIYEVVKKSEGKHTIDVRPEETLLVKRKKDYYISVCVVDSDTDGYLFMKAYLKKGVYRRHVVGKERRYPICPAIRVKGYEVAK